MSKIFVGMILAVIGFIFPFQAPVFAFTRSEFVTISGEVAGDAAGTSLASGDINGDGIEDLIVGAPDNDDAANNSGAVYLLYGSNVVLTDQTLSEAVEFRGEQAGDAAGTAVTTGDLNADGYDDILVGAPGVDRSDVEAEVGAVYIIYGKSSAHTSASLSTVTQLTGHSSELGIGDQVGSSVASDGDINGDGYEDALLGAPNFVYEDDEDEEGTPIPTATGGAYIIYGKSSKISSKTLSPANDPVLYGAVDSAAGTSVSIVGDLNSNGYDEIAIGAPAVSNSTGVVYLIYGQANAFETAVANFNTVYTGEAQGDLAGSAISRAGDLNNDGYEDMIIGSPSNDATGNDAGAVYLIYGQSANLASNTLNATGIVKWTGSTAGDNFGANLWGGRDFSTDGLTDIIIAAPFVDNTTYTNIGALYILYGQSTNFFSAAFATLSNFTVVGEQQSDSLNAVTVVDINGDGYFEIVAGSTGFDAPDRQNTGAAHIGYLQVDNDKDGVLGNIGLLVTGDDCNDNDSQTTTYKIFYTDEDGDGLGNPNQTVSTCAATAPDGYSSNSDDTNDNIMNNGLEIDGDKIDNDGDGEIDEVNTLELNSAHPHYSPLNPQTDADEKDIKALRGLAMGKIEIRFRDNAVFHYTIFTDSNPKVTVVKRFRRMGYGVVVQANGRNVALVNLFSGEVLSTYNSSKTKIYSRHKISVQDFRGDEEYEILTLSKKGKAILLTLLDVELTDGKITLYSQLKVKSKKIRLDKTIYKKNKINLRSKNKLRKRIEIDKEYNLLIPI